MTFLSRFTACSSLKLLVLSVLMAVSLPIMAMTLQQAMAALPNAKTQGLVGEQLNGYLGVINANSEADTIAKLINDARRAEYTRLAKDNNIAVADVEALAGQKAIERTQRGHFILLEGKWVQKR
ncbi:YdbL family protein [Alishewanella sp. HL-SH05]|uniref:YdbL family protein n=1 Tax=Alishewanella sp. HL-SH05 TaxID=3461145 RepID=UPI004041E5AE